MEFRRRVEIETHDSVVVYCVYYKVSLFSLKAFDISLTSFKVAFYVVYCLHVFFEIQIFKTCSMCDVFSKKILHDRPIQKHDEQYF